MVAYGPDGLYWGHGRPNFEHENSGPNSCWNWEVQKVLSRKCTAEVDAFVKSNKANDEEDKMMLCFVRSASISHNVCKKELEAYHTGKVSIDVLKRCARKEFGLAVRNIVQTSIAVGECRPIP